MQPLMMDQNNTDIREIIYYNIYINDYLTNLIFFLLLIFVSSARVPLSFFLFKLKKTSLLFCKLSCLLCIFIVNDDQG